MNKYLRDGMTEGFMLESLLMEGENSYGYTGGYPLSECVTSGRKSRLQHAVPPLIHIERYKVNPFRLTLVCNNK